MSKKVMQFRYYDNGKDGSGNSKNYPRMTQAMLASGSVFNPYYPIIQLGIQAIPGTQFYLNNSITPIIIGSTGIYELSLDGLTNITDLRFNPISIERINESQSSYLIIDIIYDDNQNVGGEI